MLVHYIEVIAEYDAPGDPEKKHRRRTALTEWASRDYDNRIVDEFEAGWITAAVYVVSGISEESAKEKAIDDFARTTLSQGIAGPRSLRAQALPPPWMDDGRG